MSEEEVYVSTDVESDGPIPGPNSMLSFASVAFRQGKEIGTFQANLQLLPGAVGDPKTMEWWKTQPEAWAETRHNIEPPETAMKRYVAWTSGLPGRPVCVCYPTGYDFTFLYWYLIRFTGGSPFSFSALDIKTYAMAILRCGYRSSTKKHMPQHWFPKGHPHTHRAMDDAREQGLLFLNMQQENERRNQRAH